MTREPQPDASIVVVSNDGYRDVWPGFFAMMARFWPDRPYPLYLISNRLAPLDNRAASIQVGEDLSWSRTLARGLERVPSRYVLLMLEDFFLTGPVDTAKVRALHEAAVALGAGYLRLAGNPNPDAPLARYPDLGTIAKGASYRTSLQMAFWDRAVLRDLLREDESAWQFELAGSRRSDGIAAPFLSVYDGISPIPYQHTVRRGKWMQEAVDIFAPLGIAFDFSRRPVESKFSVWLQASSTRRVVGRVKRFFFGPRL